MDDPHLDQNTSIIQYPHISLPTENIWASSASAGVEVARMDAIMLAAAAFRTAWGKPRPKTNLELQRENERNNWPANLSTTHLRTTFFY